MCKKQMCFRCSPAVSFVISFSKCLHTSDLNLSWNKFTNFVSSFFPPNLQRQPLVQSFYFLLICTSKWSIGCDGRARADGNWSSHFPPSLLYCGWINYAFCLEDLSFRAVLCRWRHQDTFVTVILQNWRHHYIPRRVWWYTAPFIADCNAQK